MENRSCIQQSLDKIEAELASEISVNELAKKAGYSLVRAPWARSNGCKSRTHLGNEEVYS